MKKILLTTSLILLLFIKALISNGQTNLSSAIYYNTDSISKLSKPKKNGRFEFSFTYGINYFYYFANKINQHNFFNDYTLKSKIGRNFSYTLAYNFHPKHAVFVNIMLNKMSLRNEDIVEGNKEIAGDNLSVKKFDSRILSTINFNVGLKHQLLQKKRNKVLLSTSLGYSSFLMFSKLDVNPYNLPESEILNEPKAAMKLSDYLQLSEFGQKLNLGLGLEYNYSLTDKITLCAEALSITTPFNWCRITETYTIDKGKPYETIVRNQVNFKLHNLQLNIGTKIKI